jgi:hypothetical protein
MADIVSDRKLKNPWHARAAELSRWAWDRYIVRTDVWGGYNAIADREKVIRRPNGTAFKLGPTRTCPAKSKRGIVQLTLGIVEAHFRALRPEQVIGAHTTSPENFSKFGTVEIDRHSEDSTAPEINEQAALGWYQALRGRGFRPLLWDSNRAGGFHIDLLLGEPIPTVRLFWFLRELVSNHAAYGLPSRPETFPKQSQLRPKPDGRGRYGNWVRLVGRHHTRDVWASVWDGREWVSGERAVDYLLAVEGDDPALVPEHDDIAYRARAYLAKVPHGAEGTGRDDRAFNAAAFLVRDMALSDADALRYLEEWDAGNSPPKGRERLQEIIANAHDYGHNGYGSGLRTSVPLGIVPPSMPPAEEPKDALQIILEDFRERYEPRFRRGAAIYSEILGREVKPAEGCFAADRKLLTKLAAASNAPRDKHGAVEVSALPRFFWTWSKSAWAELLKMLPEEEGTEEVCVSAETTFREAVAACLYRPETFAQTIDQHGTTRQERRSLIQWCRLWAKPGTWQQVRAALLWCRKDDEERLCVALRAGLFGVYGPRSLAELTQCRFARLAEQYGVGQAQRACGQRVVVLTPDFVAELLVAPLEETSEKEG